MVTDQVRSGHAGRHDLDVWQSAITTNSSPVGRHNLCARQAPTNTSHSRHHYLVSSPLLFFHRVEPCQSPRQWSDLFACKPEPRRSSQIHCMTLLQAHQSEPCQSSQTRCLASNLSTNTSQVGQHNPCSLTTSPSNRLLRPVTILSVPGFPVHCSRQSEQSMQTVIVPTMSAYQPTALLDFELEPRSIIIPPPIHFVS